MDEYEVRVTRQALEQMKEIVHYISYDLMSPAAADNLLDRFKADFETVKFTEEVCADRGRTLEN